ncbi:unnamed protein product [Peniophora sp. CBMAI 1063]|nr:unnamed protein product [Peniophora sp. CBMAI 1063]
MDSDWCMACERRLPVGQDLYCSPACARADNCEMIASPTTPTQSSMQAWANHSPENRIERWRSAVVPGAPGMHSDDERTPSPRPRRPTTSAHQQIPRRPKLLTQASTPVASTSLSFSSTPSDSRPLPSPVLSAPITIVNSPGRASPREHHTPPVPRPHVRPSPASSSTALTSDDSLRTPVTPVYARPEPAPTDAHRRSLWTQVKTWVGPSSAKSPHASSPAYAPYNSRASPLLVSDEDLLSTVEMDACRNSFSVVPMAADDDEPQDEGLAGWFASQMQQQKQAQQLPTPAQSVQRSAKASAAYAKRGRKLERAEARGHYFAYAR